MTQPRLPDGFAVQVDRRVRVLGAEDFKNSVNHPLTNLQIVVAVN
jgi:hypothetical protein